jgi:S1-C subfamily serine protease
MKIKSKNLLLLIFFSFLVPGCILKNRNSLTPPIDEYVKVFHRVDIISCKKDNSKNCAVGTFQTTGSGMLVDLSAKYSTGFILTAGHVCHNILPNSIENSLQYNQVMDGDGKLHDAHMVISSQDANNGPDLCILYAPSIKNVGVKISLRKPRVGDQIYYIGSPAGVFHPPVAPILPGIYSGEIDEYSAMITAPAVGGSSGSAILNDRNKIIGVLWAAHPGFHHVTLMSNFDSFQEFLRQARKLVNSI